MHSVYIFAWLAESLICFFATLLRFRVTVIFVSLKPCGHAELKLIAAHASFCVHQTTICWFEITVGQRSPQIKSSSLATSLVSRQRLFAATSVRRYVDYEVP